MHRSSTFLTFRLSSRSGSHRRPFRRISHIVTRLSYPVSLPLFPHALSLSVLRQLLVGISCTCLVLASAGCTTYVELSYYISSNESMFPLLNRISEMDAKMWDSWEEFGRLVLVFAS